MSDPASIKDFEAAIAELETVVQNSNQRGFAQMYNSCSGSAS